MPIPPQPSHGLHLMAELHGCGCAVAGLCDATWLRALCLAEVHRAGLHVVGELFHSFAPEHPETPAGVTGVLLLAESHLALHTWPELGLVTLDIYVCNRSHDAGPAARQVFKALVEHFAPQRVVHREVDRSAVCAAG
ncbi:adenosylmethionine decarboxylase [Leptothrix ochracea]|uniref:adenosylmethionine decarboxylase n=2 Tax=Leptothrix ochracea TaxID=735331 RepID=UPI0034E21973